MDKYSVDAHKLMYHPATVAAWRRGFPIAPLYVEISPTSSCNHKCTFCALDFHRKGDDRLLDRDATCVAINEMGRDGVKAIMFGGEGEPLLSEHLETFIRAAVTMGTDTAITTNGALLHSHIEMDTILDHCKWIKISIDAGYAKTYQEIHRCPKTDFYQVLSNAVELVEKRRKKKSEKKACAIGMQMLLLPENIDEALGLVNIAKDIGVDYLIIKPFSQHPLSETTKYMNNMLSLDDMNMAHLRGISTSDFQVIVREQAFEQLDGICDYEACLALPFWRYIDSAGDVWSCSTHIGNDEFYLGNISKGWGSLASPQRTFGNIFECRVNCRMHNINKYLWRLEHPEQHDNFI